MILTTASEVDLEQNSLTFAALLCNPAQSQLLSSIQDYCHSMESHLIATFLNLENLCLHWFPLLHSSSENTCDNDLF